LFGWLVNKILCRPQSSEYRTQNLGVRSQNKDDYFLALNQPIDITGKQCKEKSDRGICFLPVTFFIISFSLMPLFPLLPVHVNGHKTHPDADGRVGHVERGPGVLVPVDLEEVDDFSEPYPVDQVADRSCKDQ